MGGGDDIQVQNPGNIDLKASNPQAYAQMQYLQNMRDQFQNSSMNAMDPYKYDMRRNDSINRNQTAIQNRFANMGFAGSSMSVGAASEGARQTGFAWDDRQMSDMSKSIAVQQGLTDDMTGDIFKIQNQFGDYQTQMTNAQIAQQNQENEMWGNIMKAGGMIGGAALAGPVGAQAGGAAGGMAAPGQSAYLQPSNTGTYYDGSGNGGYSVGGAYGNYGQPMGGGYDFSQSMYGYRGSY